MDKKKSHFFFRLITTGYISDDKLFTLASQISLYHVANGSYESSFLGKSGVIQKAKNTPHHHELGDAGWGVTMKEWRPIRRR